MTALEDESTQRLGIVAIVVGPPNNYCGRVSGKMYMLNNGLPFRKVAIHCCLMKRDLLARLILVAFGKEMRLRFRIHMEGR